MVLDTPAVSQEDHPAPQRQRLRGPVITFALVGGIAGWALQVAGGSALAGYACFSGFRAQSEPSLPHLSASLMVVDAVAIFLGVASFLTALYCWQRTRDEKPGSVHMLLAHGDGRSRFLAMSAVMVSLLFLIGNCAQTLSLAFLSPCI